MSLDEWFGSRIHWLFVAALGLTTAAVFRDFLLPIKSYLFKDIGSDTINSLYPQLVHIADYLRRWGLPEWSFSQGMGQNLYPDSLGDPFNSLLYLLGREKLVYGLAYVAVLKVLMAGALFHTFLRLRQMQPFTAGIFGLCLAFCGSMIVGGTWYVYSTTVVYAALALIASECLFLRRHTWLFPLTVALIAALNAIYIYLFGVFILSYLIVRYLEHDCRDSLTFPQLAARAVGLGLIGLALAAVFTLPSAMQMLESPRGGGPASARARLFGAPVFSLGDVRYYATIILRSYSSDLLGTGSAFRGWANYAEAPIHYCGLLCLLLAPQVFRTAWGQLRLAFSALTVGALLVHVFPWLRHAFWLFSGDWFRALSLFVSILLLLFSARALDAIVRRGSLNVPLLAGTWIVLMILLYFPYDFGGSQAVNETARVTAAVFLTLETVLTLALAQPQLRTIGQASLLAVVSLELFVFSSPAVNARPVVTVKELHERIGYSDETIDALRAIRAHDVGFFRVEKDYASSPAADRGLNDAKAQGYFGTSSFHSFNQPNYIRFLAGMGVIDPRVPEQTTWAPGLGERPVLQTFASLRYWLIRGDYRQQANTAQLLGSVGQVKILRNENFIPLGFGLESYVLESECRRLTGTAKDAVLLEAVIVPDSAARSYSRFAHWGSSSFPARYSFPEYAADARRCARNAMITASWDQNRIEGGFQSASPQVLVFSIPFDRGWTVRVDGRPAALRRIDFGVTGLEVGPGRHAIALRYRPPFVGEGLLLSVIGLLALATVGVLSISQRIHSSPPGGKVQTRS